LYFIIGVCENCTAVIFIHIGDNIIRWKKKRFGIGNKKTSMIGDDEDVIVVEDENVNDANEETTFSNIV